MTTDCILRWPMTLGALLLSGMLDLLVMAADIEVFEALVVLMERLEDYEIDELLVLSMLVLPVALIELFLSYQRKRNAAEQESLKLRTLQSTMRTVQDILGNFLNNLMVFRLQAEESGAISEEELRELDQMIQDTAQRVNRLADVEVVVEKELTKGLYWVEETPSPGKDDDQIRPG